ncbi:hypothetical protein H5410_047091, partial [Solanum commersonii]
INVEPRCGLCRTNDESRDHLFLSCSYTINLLVRFMQWIKRPMTFHTEVIQTIWIERYLRIFKMRSKDAESIIKEVAYVCNVRSAHNSITTPRNPTLIH